MLVDNVNIVVNAGKGGSGLVSFRKEKFKPFGGPDGGDGGKGGDIYISASVNLRDLASFKHKRHYQAGNGKPGGSNKMHGNNGENLVIEVPVGTYVYVKEEGVEKLLGDLHNPGYKMLIAEGGKGGRGNVHFATSTRKAPKIAQPGTEGQKAELVLKLKLPADVVIIGLPNSGKSTLLSSISGAKPEIADYPFTTREPVLGAVDQDLRKYTWVELPALISGSGEGKGLGNQFLKHAEKARVLIYLLDINSPTLEDDIITLQKEVSAYDQALFSKKSFIVLNKVDLSENPEGISMAGKSLAGFGLTVYPISGRERNGLEELIRAIHASVAEALKSGTAEPEPETVFRPKPVDRRD